MVQQTQCPPTISSQTRVEQATSLQSSGSNIHQVQRLAAIQDTVEVPAVCAGVQSVLAALSVAEFQTTGTGLHAQRAYSDTSSSAATELGSIASFLLRSSLQPSSIPTYQRAWKLFHSTLIVLILHCNILFMHCLFHHLFWPYFLLICSIHGMLHPL